MLEVSILTIPVSLSKERVVLISDEVNLETNSKSKSNVSSLSKG
jgi:hypothetical protein